MAIYDAPTTVDVGLSVDVGHMSSLVSALRLKI